LSTASAPPLQWKDRESFLLKSPVEKRVSNKISLVTKSISMTTPKSTDLPERYAYPISRDYSRTPAEIMSHWHSTIRSKRILLFLAFFLTGFSISLADKPLSVQVQRPWMRAVPDVMDVTAVYMILVNTGSVPAELVGGSTSIADSVELMITTQKGEGLKKMLGMKAVSSLEIPAHGALILEPNGNHLMLMGLKKHPKAGTRADFAIKLEPGDQEVHLEMPVSTIPVK
jgi:periplasmic copper chaperone A